MKTADQILREHLAKLGRKGGKSTSEAKREASRRNGAMRASKKKAK
jgi:hypothetical protein